MYRIVFVALGWLVLSGCSHLNLIPESEEMRLGVQAYREILAEEVPSNDAEMNEILTRVGRRIAAAANKPDYEWEFRLIESPQMNAFCLPGGKIAVYSGILPIMKHEAGMAIVLGHEACHALLHHGGIRMTQQGLFAGGEKILGFVFKDAAPAAQKAVLGAYGGAAKLGFLLPYSRTHELEADSDGLILAAKAGYDPREAVALWERMRDSHDGERIDFLSTHPSEDRRIEKMKKRMAEALEVYEAAEQQYGTGQQWN
jgi:predicted Zn-dependent protease